MWNLYHETRHTWTYVTIAPLRCLNKSTLRLFSNYNHGESIMYAKVDILFYFLVSSIILWISDIVIPYLFLLEKEIQENNLGILLISIFLYLFICLQLELDFKIIYKNY